MSQTEIHYIKLKEVKVDNLEEWLKKKCQEVKPEIENPSDIGEDTWREVYDYYLDEENQDHKILNGKLYKIIKHKNLDYDDNDITINEDGEIEILTSFYNGGCSLDEALEWNLDKLNNKHDKMLR